MLDSTSSNPSVHYALQVALQTMKERCLDLQERLSNVENENQNLRERIEEGNFPEVARSSEPLFEIRQLRIQVADLQRQKAQLSDHITMVSNENRKLWSRLSQMSKEQEKNEDLENTLVNESVSDGSPRNAIHQNLIRSKTFTQHSPNPNLRQKLISNRISNCNDEIENDLSKMSLEEVTLESKFSVKGRDCDEMGFGYLNDYNEEETDYHITDEDAEENQIIDKLKALLESVQDMKTIARQQQDELELSRQFIQNKKSLKTCTECEKKSQKPEMADKSLETDESLNGLNLYKTNSQMAVLESHNMHNNTVDSQTLPTPRLNIIEEKIAADAHMHTCPICGRVYGETVTFSAFREHVEEHFLDETSDLEPSIERNFEMISHTVGDF